MPVPPIPPPIENLGNRSFSFYPPILNTEHNEWHFRRATWSEILVANAKSGEEIWIPRRFLGELSSIEEPVVIVGLTKELEYMAGQVVPHVRRIIEMPRAVNDTQARPVPVPVHTGAAPVVAIKLENSAESHVGRMIFAVMVIGVVACVTFVGIFVFTREGNRVVFRPIVQSSIGLSAGDDYFAVVRKLGKPVDDRWKSGANEMRFRLLSYPDQGVMVVLMGTDERNARYVGAFDSGWHVVDSVSLPGGGSTQPMLRSLSRF